MTVPRKRKIECPIERCIAVVSGRWKARILWRLFIEPHSFSALQASLPGVPQRALSQALAELSADGVIARGTAGWASSPLGDAMRPALAAMFDWGNLSGSRPRAATDVAATGTGSAAAA